jgi:uncharacterized protein (DUF433 family)
MGIEHYFNFLSEDDIRIAGTRVGIETVLYDYICRCKTAEQIADTYPFTNLEQVYATILYYLQNREKVEAYLVDWLEHGERMRREQEENLPPVILRPRRIAAQSDAT